VTKKKGHLDKLAEREDVAGKKKRTSRFDGRSDGKDKNGNLDVGQI